MTSTLKVDNIAHSGGTTGMTIDSSGRVSRSVLPSFFVNGTADWFDFGNTFTQIFKTATFAVSTDHNVGNTYDASTGNFTASMAGLWQFQCNVYCGNTGDVQSAWKPYKNGATHRHMAGYAVSPSNDSYPDVTSNLTWCWTLAVGDTVGIFMKEDCYGYHCNWSGFFVG